MGAPAAFLDPEVLLRMGALGALHSGTLQPRGTSLSPVSGEQEEGTWVSHYPWSPTLGPSRGLLDYMNPGEMDLYFFPVTHS